jgi:uncharacterized membrane protein YoaK (UPF0700 family)
MRTQIYERENLVQLRSLSLWLALALCAGAINAYAFIKTSTFVSHVTGTVTRLGIGFAELQWLLEVELLVAFMCFIGGCFFSSFILERNIWKKKRPQFFIIYGVNIVLLSLMYFFASEEGHFIQVWMECVILAFVCGALNAMAVIASQGFVRVTHLTGISTDIGMGLARLLFSPDVEQKKREKEFLFLRLQKVFAFLLGCFLQTLLCFFIKDYAIIPLITIHCLLFLYSTKYSVRELLSKSFFFFRRTSL